MITAAVLTVGLLLGFALGLVGAFCLLELGPAEPPPRRLSADEQILDITRETQAELMREVERQRRRRS